MSESMGVQAVLPKRCKTCRELFSPKRRMQAYCSKYCRRRAVYLRKHGAARPALRRRELVQLHAVLADAAEAREQHALPPLAGCPYLNAYAALAEAEEQLRAWQERLHARRKQLAGLADPDYRLRRVVLRPGEALETTARDTHIGTASTAGDLAVVCLGRLVGGDEKAEGSQ